MKIIITENQLRTLSEQMVSDEQCIQPEIEDLNSVFNGLGELFGAEYEDQEILDQTSDPKQKKILSQILKGLQNMDEDQLKQELNKVMSLKNLKEQGTPYLEQTIDIAGTQVPKVAVHGLLALIAISILSKLLKMIPQNQSRRGSRLRSKAVGCQGAGARARLVRRRRRREAWRSFLRKLGIR
jgi:hypothetical protein